MFSLLTQTGESSKINDVKNLNHSDKGQYDSVCNNQTECLIFPGLTMLLVSPNESKSLAETSFTKFPGMV